MIMAQFYLKVENDFEQMIIFIRDIDKGQINFCTSKEPYSEFTIPYEGDARAAYNEVLNDAVNAGYKVLYKKECKCPSGDFLRFVKLNTKGQ